MLVGLFSTLVVGLVLTMVLLPYIMLSIAYMFLFETLGISKGKAFIPIYSTYLLYKEYKGRVWKKNWGVLYLSLFAGVIVVIVLLIGMFALLGNGNAGSELPATALILMFLIGILALAMLAAGVILNVILYWPLMEKTWHKAVFIVYMLFGFGTSASTVNMNSIAATDAYEAGKNYGNGLFTFLFYVFLIYLAYSIKNGVVNGTKVLASKLDYTKHSDSDIKNILSARGRSLVADREVTAENNDNMYV